ncbi:MAG TPA: putative zinc-binding peptidase [Steroidobacteraceae bacterium]
MKTFHCGVCQSLIFFENSQCLHCGAQLAYVAGESELLPLSEGKDGLWRTPVGSRLENQAYRLCANYQDHQICNWALPSGDVLRLCESCRLTSKIPDLSLSGSIDAWRKLEAAKRRLLYAIFSLRLPVIGKRQDEIEGLEFQFLSDGANGQGDHSRIMTGHDNGVITINIAEADDAYREAQRRLQREPYRTLLGHFRHEIGHYYWDRLIARSGRLEEYREIFGDERAHYSQALDVHYQQGPPMDWDGRYISAYASAHPWEDWAESWAHLLYMLDSLETAQFLGLSINPARRDDPSLKIAPVPLNERVADFGRLAQDWTTLTYVLNNLTRGLGLADTYPIALGQPVLKKLKFVCEVVSGAAR